MLAYNTLVVLILKDILINPYAQNINVGHYAKA